MKRKQLSPEEQRRAAYAVAFYAALGSGRNRKPSTPENLAAAHEAARRAVGGQQ